MVVHFVSGIAGGFSNMFFGLRAPTAALLAALLMAVWELIEYWRGITEFWSNRVLDVVIGAGGALVALRVSATLSHRQQLWSFGVSMVTATVLSTIGWLAYRRRIREDAAS